jgi:aconitase B
VCDSAAVRSSAVVCDSVTVRGSARQCAVCVVVWIVLATIPCIINHRGAGGGLLAVCAKYVQHN